MVRAAALLGGDSALMRSYVTKLQKFSAERDIITLSKQTEALYERVESYGKEF